MRDDVDRDLAESSVFPGDPSRLTALSDGVFAVALTLLVLDVKPPQVNPALLGSAVLAMAPRLGIFALSFAIVTLHMPQRQGHLPDSNALSYCSSSTGCLCFDTNCACVCGGTGA